MGAKLAGPAAGSRFNVEQNSEINVTPFVDVMLVLLIIFMVAAPLATVSVTLTLPEAIAPVTPNPAKPVYISIQQSVKIFGRRSAHATRRRSGFSSAPTGKPSTATSCES